jgi:hypothetical protein
MLEFDINQCLSLYWLITATGALLPGLWLLIDNRTNINILHRFLQRFYLFGKLKGNESLMATSIIGNVPKRYFLHFYIVGLVINLPLFIIYRTSIILFSIVILHICQRLYECLFVHCTNERSTMSFIHYLLGILHYALLGINILVDQTYEHAQYSLTLVCSVLFIYFYASYIQYCVHVTLARNRRQTQDNRYPMPHGYWLFKYISCPNYLAEIIIYIAFFTISHRSLSILSLTVWVIVNQTLSALLMHRWYRQNYGSNYSSNIRALIPYLL